MAVDRSKNNGAVGMFGRKSYKKIKNSKDAGQDFSSSKSAAIKSGEEDKFNNSVAGKVIDKLGKIIENNTTTGTWKSVGGAMQTPDNKKNK